MPETCPACKSPTSISKTFETREDFPIQVNICAHCRHHFQSISEYKDIYTSGEFSESSSRNHEPTAEEIKDRDKRAMDRIEFYGDILNRANSILEVGSAFGSFLHLVKIRGKKITGLEPDKDYASFSQKQYFFEQEYGLLEEYQPEKKFDLVCAFHVIEHIEKPETFVNGLWHLLNDNGSILLECPSMEIKTYGNLKYTMWKPHMHYFTLSSMYALIAQKFKIVELGYYGAAVYVHAQKSNQSTFNGSEFLKYKRKASITEKLISFTPSISAGGTDRYKIRQFLLQPFIQKETIKKLRRYTQVGAFSFRTKWYEQTRKGTSNDFSTHLAYNDAWQNAGDMVLADSTQLALNGTGTVSWQTASYKTKPTDAFINQINRSRYLLLGGGATLFSAAVSHTGWSWTFTKENLEKITTPIVILGIGFKDSATLNDQSIQNLNALIRKSSFFGVRDYYSIESIKAMVDESIHHHIIYQPCPTTVINKFLRIKKPGNQKRIGINVSFDDYAKAYGSKIYLILDQLAATVKKLEQSGYRIYNIHHTETDRRFELALQKWNVKYQPVNLHFALPQKIAEFYASMDLVMGTRAHAQLIPFGTGTRILTLGTHQKVRNFLTDINELDWYDDISQEPEGLSERLLHKFSIINEKEKQLTDQHLKQAQEKLYEITLQNKGVIQEQLKLK